MVDPDNGVPTSFDPFVDREVAEDVSFGSRGKEYVHIRIQQRNGKKCVTTVQGLKEELGYDKVLKNLKGEFCCNGNVVQDQQMGRILQLQDDQRKNVSKYLVKAELVKKEQITLHGY